MPLTKDPGLDVATFLAAQGIGLTLGTNLFVGEERPSDPTIPGKAVFVLVSGGDTPLPTLGTSKVIWKAGLQIISRGDTGDFQGAASLSRQVASKLLFASPSGYIAVFTDDSFPIPLGSDSNGRFQWMHRVSAWWYE